MAMFKGEGEGSRGGKIIGHTSGGKPVYANARHPEHKAFSKEDHLEAAHMHHGARERLADEHYKQRNNDGTVSTKHINKRKQITKEIERHAQQAAYHAAKYEGKKSSPSQKDFDRMDRKNDPQKRSKAWNKSDPFAYVVDEDDFIEKSRGAHKYVKRTGTPGNYKYWYRLPDGQIVQGNDTQQEAGKLDHLKRLVAAKQAGHHSLEDHEIAAKVGMPTHRVRWTRSNLNQSARTTGRPHPYERHHLDEAHADPSHHSYERHITAAVDHESSRASSAPARRPRRASPRRSRAAAPVAPAAPAAETNSSNDSRREPSAPEAVQLRSDGYVRIGGPVNGGWRHPDGSEVWKDDNGTWSAKLPNGEWTEGHRYLSSAQEAQRVPSPAPAPAAKTPSERIAKLRAKLAEKHGIVLGEAPAEPDRNQVMQEEHDHSTRLGMDQDEADHNAQQAGESHDAERAPPTPAHHPESNPGTPHARELAREVPDFGASEQEIQRSVQAQQNGHNPYLHRAVEIFHRIRGDLKPERKDAIDHFFQAHDAVQARGQVPTRENVLEAYKAIPGNERKRTLPAKEFESGTFHTMDEVFDNPPINPEVERMKRGYAAKQFQRLKPFLKDDWMSANPSAPPPMPTFGDLKSWTEHGGPKPSWAGNTRMAVPEEVFNASHKSPDGKPKYPPAWMPIHLMPVWIYAAKSMEREGGASVWESGRGGAPAYAAHKTPQLDESSSTGFRVDMGSQARSGQEFRDHGPEGMIVNAMRKYVQMRGGPDQLTDIPGSKLGEAGITHRDIFKSDMSDAALKKMVTTKIVDPVGLMAVLKREMKSAQKSFALVVDIEESYIPGSTLHKSEPHGLTIDIVKSAKIDRIKGILSARGRS
jgi:hypothetical protein